MQDVLLSVPPKSIPRPLGHSPAQVGGSRESLMTQSQPPEARVRAAPAVCVMPAVADFSLCLCSFICEMEIAAGTPSKAGWGGESRVGSRCKG